jgi:hypothetical protein
VWQLGSDELLRIGAPSVQNLAQEPLFGKDAGPGHEQKHQKTHFKLLLLD